MVPPIRGPVTTFFFFQAEDGIRGADVTGVQTCALPILDIVLCWHMHGRGNRTSQTPIGLVLFRGDWSAGTKASYPFELELPNGPHSYHGHYLNVDWFLRARADIPWAIDPKAEREILLGPGPKTDPATYINVANGAHDVFAKRKGNKGFMSIFMLLFSLPFIGAGLFVMLLGLIGGPGMEAIFLVPFGGVFFLSGAVVFFFATRNKFAAMKLGDIRLAWPEGIVHPGDDIPISCQIDATKGLNGVNATLVCRETVVSGSGTNRSTYRHDIFSRAIELKQSAQGGKRLSLEGGFGIPDDSPVSFYASDNELSWIVVVHIDIARWPDWKRELYLDVRPKPPVQMLAAKAAPPAPVAEKVVDVVDGFENTEAW